MRIVTEHQARSHAALIAAVAKEKGEERAAKCGYDLMQGLVKGDDQERAEAWSHCLKQPTGCGIDAERDGVWVPAIPVKFSHSLLDRLRPWREY